MAKAMSLLKAYQNNAIPSDGGFIICSFLNTDSSYSIYEITAYRNVKDIFKSPEGWVFRTDGNRAHILVEPATYSGKSTEPVYRQEGSSIPYRFSELKIITGKRLEKIMISQEPVWLYSNFTILESKGNNFCFVFYPSEDVYVAIRIFLGDALYNDSGLMKEDALLCAQQALEPIKKFKIWNA